jgi:exodeoxyribonuclease VII large subunit
LTTAAAELAVPVRAELFATLAELIRRGRQCLSRQADRARERYDLTVCRWPRPDSLLAPLQQSADEIGDRLPRALSARAGHARAELNGVAPRLRHEMLTDRLSRASERLASLWKMAELAHPDRPLSRGFARVTDRHGETLTAAAQARAARELSLHFGDGVVDALVGPAAPVKLERPRRRAYLSPQPGLFDASEE